MRVPEKHILPDIPGKVHGIKGMKPCIVQCDGCGKTATGEVWRVVLTSGIIFNARATDDDRRMCENCWKRDGWTEDNRGWNQR